MGTACKEGSHIGIIPRAMAALFDKIENLKTQVEFQLRVSFIEVQELFQILACRMKCQISSSDEILHVEPIGAHLLFADSERRGEGST